jgi:hypothetical protein
MTRYYFHIRGDQPFTDVDGLDLPDAGAARSEATGVVGDLMRMEPLRRDWSSWSICVADEDQAPVLEVKFANAA